MAVFITSALQDTQTINIPRQTNLPPFQSTAERGKLEEGPVSSGHSDLITDYMVYMMHFRSQSQQVNRALRCTVIIHASASAVVAT